MSPYGTGPLDAPAGPPVVYYHVAPAAQRESIQANGLMGHMRDDEEDHGIDSPWQELYDNSGLGQPSGNYLFTSPHAANQYAYNLAYRSAPVDRHRGEVDEESINQEMMDSGIYDGRIMPQQPHDWNEDDDGDWYETDDANSEGPRFDHQDPEHLGLLPNKYKGFDIWKVHVDPAKQTVMRDPEDALQESKMNRLRRRFRDEVKLFPEEGELSTAEALHGWTHSVDGLDYTPETRGEDDYPEHDHTADRWYTPHRIHPQQLQHHKYFPMWDLDSYGDEASEFASWDEIPEQFGRVPFKRTGSPWAETAWEAPVAPAPQGQQFYYHTAPSALRERIGINGLDPAHARHGLPKPFYDETSFKPEDDYRVWMFPSVDDAKWYNGDHEGMDIWRVNADGLDLRDQEQHGEGMGYTTHQRVPSSRLDLVHQAPALYSSVATLPEDISPLSYTGGESGTQLDTKLSDTWLPPVLYHWTEMGKWPEFAQGDMRSGMYLTTASDPEQDWNPDIPYLRHPLRVTIDTAKLDPLLFGQDPMTGEGYGGTPISALQNSGNVYYTGPVPPEAIADLQQFRQPEEQKSWELEHMPDEHFLSKVKLSGEGWTQCEQGHWHWGTTGAAGALISHTDEQGVQRYFLTHRSQQVDHPGTWSVPGGAMDDNEHPHQAALRETAEEIGHEPNINITHTTTDDHGGWAYHTVHATTPQMFTHQPNWETQDSGWFTPEEVSQLPLHPGFAGFWQSYNVGTDNPQGGQNPSGSDTRQGAWSDRDMDLGTEYTRVDSSRSIHNSEDSTKARQQHTADMPADPEWWQGYSDDKSLWHGTNRSRLPFILQDGLTPWDDDANSFGSNYGNEFEYDPDTDWLMPRPGHVYMTTQRGKAEAYARDGGSSHSEGHEPVVLELDRSFLDPQHINPDEDTSSWANKNWRTYNDVDPDDDWGDLPEEFKSLGDVAEEKGYGDRHDVTQMGIENANTLAYRGTLPPEAIKAVHWRTPQGWQQINRDPQVHPQQQSLFAKQAAWHFADKLHDFLMNPKSRPDLQTPEAQAFLYTLKHRYHSDKTDKLMPWLAREWKKGRIHHPLNPGRDPGHLHMHPDGPPQGEYDPFFGALGTLNPGTLEHWADWLNSGHATSRGDIMQKKLRDVIEGSYAWDEEMKAKAHEEALGSGEIAHQYPDGWSLQKLTTPEALKAEGDAMGHCVGGYGNAVANGRSMIYSLRDHNNSPHTTLEISPTQSDPPDPRWLEEAMVDNQVARALPDEHKDYLREYHQRLLSSPDGTLAPHPLSDGLMGVQGLYNQLARQYAKPIAKPHSGRVVQVQGKGNAEPLHEYKARLKDWFTTFPPETRPTSQNDDWEGLYDREGWTHDTLAYPDLIPEYEERYGRLHKATEGSEDQYGLISKAQPMEADYDSLLKNIGIHEHGAHATHNGQHVDDIYRLALARGEIPQLGEAASGYDQHAQEMFDEWESMNADYFPRYPDETTPSGYHDPDGEEVDGPSSPMARPYWSVSPYGYDSDNHYDPDEAAKAYDEEMTELYRQHPETQASTQLHSLLNQHAATPEGQYTNDLKPQPPKTAGMTLPQELRKWQELYTTELEPIHRFDDGSTIRQARGDEAARRVGEMMHNCWQDAEPQDMQDGPYGAMRSYGWDWLSLHDPHGIPRAAFYRTPQNVVSEVYGMRNNTPHPDYANKVAEWGQANGVMFHEKGADRTIHPDEWADSIREFYEDQYQQRLGAKRCPKCHAPLTIKGECTSCSYSIGSDHHSRPERLAQSGQATKQAGWGEEDEISPQQIAEYYRPYSEFDGRTPQPGEPVPAFLYHKAPQRYQHSIRQHGLLPDATEVGATRNHEWSEPGVYMTTSPTNAWGSNAHLWRVDARKLDRQHFRQDPNISNAWYYTERVPPDALQFHPHPSAMVEKFKERNPHHDIRPVIGASVDGLELGNPQCSNCGSTDLSASDYPQPIYQCRDCNAYTKIPNEGYQVQRTQMPVYSLPELGPMRQGRTAGLWHEMAIGYHVAARANRESIQASGLKAQMPLVPGGHVGVYLWDSEERAQEYAQPQDDIYEVRLPVPHVMADPNSAYEGAFVYPVNIGPEYVKLLREERTSADHSLALPSEVLDHQVPASQPLKPHSLYARVHPIDIELGPDRYAKAGKVTSLPDQNLLVSQSPITQNPCKDTPQSQGQNTSDVTKSEERFTSMLCLACLGKACVHDHNGPWLPSDEELAAYAHAYDTAQHTAMHSASSSVYSTAHSSARGVDVPISEGPKGIPFVERAYRGPPRSDAMHFQAGPFSDFAAGPLWMEHTAGDSLPCPQCGATDEFSNGLCYSCGYGSADCPRCGFEVGDNDGFCPSCHYTVGHDDLPSPTPAWTMEPEQVTQMVTGLPRNHGSSEDPGSAHNNLAREIACPACQGKGTLHNALCSSCQGRGVATAYSDGWQWPDEGWGAFAQEWTHEPREFPGAKQGNWDA